MPASRLASSTTCIRSRSAATAQVAFERYYTGHDEKILKDLGTVAFTPDTLHDLRSVTKSVVNILYGIALDRGLVPPPERRSLRCSRSTPISSPTRPARTAPSSTR